MDNNWYNSGNGDWYSPLESSGAKAGNEAVKPVKEKKNLSGLWWTLGILCLAALLISSSLYFSDKLIENKPVVEYKEAPQLPDSFNYSYSGDFNDFGTMLPDIFERFGMPNPFIYGNSGDSDTPDDSSEMPNNPETFFNNFYTNVTTDIAEIEIERAETPIDYSLSIQAPLDEELSLTELYNKCFNSVVGITGYTEGKNSYSWGSGFVISEDGLIVTNTHVIDNCDKAMVTLADDTEYEAKLVGADSINDIAVLKIEATGLIPVELGDSSALVVGQNVAAIGNPLGESYRLTLTNGIVSAINRGIDYNGHTMTLIQTNTAINEGNSGGPLFNMYGQVVGITNMKMMSSYSSIEGIGFAIPATTIRATVNSILTYGEFRGRPSIGITVGGIPETAAERYKLPEGLYITAVSDGSDAKEKGILPGDVLTHVNGIAVSTTAEVAAIKNECAVGDIMVLTIYRDGKTTDYKITLVDTMDIYK